MTDNQETNKRRVNVYFGILAGVGAAIAYTGANIYLRATATDVEPLLVSFIKALSTWACCAPLYFYGWRHYPQKLPDTQATFLLIGAAIFVQLCGSVGLQFALGLIGVALTIPLVMGTMVVTGAVLGRVYLGEPIQAVFALTLLIISIAVLGADAGTSHAHMQTVQKVLPVAWSTSVGVLAACLTGLTYSVLGVAIRRALREPVHPFTPIMFVTVTGIVILGPLVWWRLGWTGIVAVEFRQWMGMLWGGIFNALGFVCLSYAFKHLNMIYVSAINVSQVAMAAIAGVMIFGEPTTGFLLVGLLMMCASFLFLGVSQYWKHRIVSPVS